MKGDPLVEKNRKKTREKKWKRGTLQSRPVIYVTRKKEKPSALVP